MVIRQAPSPGGPDALEVPLQRKIVAGVVNLVKGDWVDGDHTEQELARPQERPLAGILPKENHLLERDWGAYSQSQIEPLEPLTSLQHTSCLLERGKVADFVPQAWGDFEGHGRGNQETGRDLRDEV